jgi:hypothetical protein
MHFSPMMDIAAATAPTTAVAQSSFQLIGTVNRRFGRSGGGGSFTAAGLSWSVMKRCY